MNKNIVGKTNLLICDLGIGTAPIGGWPNDIDENTALQTLDAA